MEIATIKTLVRIAKIIGDEDGISINSVIDEAEVSIAIPSVLQEVISQLNAYIEGKGTDFAFKLNPSGVMQCSVLVGSFKI